ncbi:MAG TPA: PilC/PilY family type IV pilus protein [Gammaproteobacteria bacterium]
MKTTLHRIRDASLAFLLGAIPLSNALADDIQIYVGGNSNVGGVAPNILFVIDTSGSMSGQVDLDSGESGSPIFSQNPYDPNTDYPGECVDSRYYWDDDSNFPDCGTDQYIEASSFFCQAALDAFATSGRFMDRYASWRNGNNSWRDYWTDVSDRRQTRYTECKADSGNHGDGVDNGKVYAADRWDGPWSTDSDDSINWNDREILTFMNGNFLNWYHSAAASQPSTRLEVVQYVTKALIDSVSNVNFGLMRFDSGASGGMVLFPVEDINTNRAAMKAAIDSLTPNGGTPLSETYYEAIQYYRGDDVVFGLDSKVGWSSVPSVPESRGNGDSDLNDPEDNQYRSPIEYQCQKNFIVFLTDGEPTSDSHAGYRIKNWPGFGSLNDSCHDSISGDCLDEAALWARNRDVMPSIAGDQNVITYMVGFAEEVSVLEETATKGGGDFYMANNALELLNVFTNIITEILAINSTFTAPAVSVNAFNRTVHLNQLFFTVFKPSQKPHWNGNLKRFDVGKVNPTDDDVTILDALNKPAVDPNTGFFKDTAVSHWTNSDQSPDGGEAALGGAAGDITLPRDVYTYTGTTNLLTNPSNAFHESNTQITKTALGIDGQTDDYRTTLIQWARGVDTEDVDDDGYTNDARRIMGDPLHSKPVVITYGGTAEDPEFSVFMTTNDGFLHAVDGETGAEHFAFIPQSKWSNLDKLYSGLAGANSKVYGLDSPITAWVNDVDKDGTIESGDHVYLYFGERRGGNSYYAIDVTDREAPKFLWRISNASVFTEMGQTFSQPRLARINVGGISKQVLIFGGGYDPDQDSADTYVPDDQGRAIYIVDALTGSLIWWAGPTGSGADLVVDDLQNSIPAEVRVVDVDSDGFHDRMYAADTGGRIFRFDIFNGNTVDSLVTGGKIASLGAADMATPTMQETRKFFEPPDVAMIVDEEHGNYLNIAIGSGNRANPLKTGTLDKFFSIRDPYVLTVPPSYDYGITVGSLYDATDNVIGQGTDTEKETAITALFNRNGWYIDLVDSSETAVGEKALARATTFDGTIFFTTYTPVSAAQSTGCAPSQGLARAYAVDVQYATPVYNNDGLGDESNLTRSDRAVTLTRGGIPPEVTILFPEASDDPFGVVGTEELNINFSKPAVRTYWYEEDES